MCMGRCGRFWARASLQPQRPVPFFEGYNLLASPVAINMQTLHRISFDRFLFFFTRRRFACGGAYNNHKFSLSLYDIFLQGTWLDGRAWQVDRRLDGCDGINTPSA